MKIDYELQKHIDYFLKGKSLSDTLVNNEELFKDKEINIVKEKAMTNIVPKNKLRKVQLETLSTLREIISNTYGPMSSYTNIISGEDLDNEKSEYSKDGLKVLKNIKFSKPIEMSIETEIEQIARYVEKKVGDGTTSAVILSDLIFRSLVEIEAKNTIPPRRIAKVFQDIVDELKDIILSKRRDISIEDVYNIAMISTNGNEIMSRQIEELYKRFGFNVKIDVGTSNDTNTKIKEYDGLTIDEGYSDVAYINSTVDGTVIINNPRIYGFDDPIDTPEMISFLEAIIANNIWNRLAEGEEAIPTVILAPMISLDASGLLKNLISKLYEFNTLHMESQKPPILIVSNLSGTQVTVYRDILHLCGGKTIQKYINPDVQKKDQESGLAPTVENISDFCGTCERIIADEACTRFYNPPALTDPENTSYTNLIAMLEAELERAIVNNEDALTITRTKKRLAALKSDLVELLVGGITFTDRDSTKDLVEDAVKNIASASVEGVGRAANYEGLLAISELIVKYHKYDENNDLKLIIMEAIFKAYVQAAAILYSTVVGDNYDCIKLALNSIENGNPYDVIELFDSVNNSIDYSDIKGSDKICCSIYTDIEILNAISRIVTLMVTSNQVELQTPGLNRY